MPVTQVSSRGLRYALRKTHAEHVHEGGKDHEVGRPGVDGTNEPAELHPGHDVLHAFEGFIGAGAVIQQQQDAGEHLNDEEEQRDAAEEIPVRKAMGWNGLMAQRLDETVKMKPFVEPANDCGNHGYASRFRLTTISSPRTWTSKTSSGLGGGPEMLRPLRS